MPECEVTIEPHNDSVETVVSGDGDIEATGEIEVLNFDGLEVKISYELRLTVDYIFVHVVDEALSHHIWLHDAHVDAVYVIPVRFLPFIVADVLDSG